jgi:hypothetical protein
LVARGPGRDGAQRRSTLWFRLQNLALQVTTRAMNEKLTRSNKALDEKLPAWKGNQELERCRCGTNLTSRG